MPQEERGKYLYDNFCQMFPAFTEHVESWDRHDDDQIIVRMKKDSYFTSGRIYIFGDGGTDSWHLEQLTRTYC